MRTIRNSNERAPALERSGLTAAQLLQGYTASSLVYCFEKIGLWDLLSRQQVAGARHLAALLHLDLARTEALVVAGTRLGILQVDAEGRVLLTPLGRELFREKSRFIVAVGGYGDVFGHLAELIRGSLRYGVDVRRDDADVARGCAQTHVPQVVDTFDSVLESIGVRRIADLGCADANRLVHVCQRFANASGLGVDISPKACELARRRVAGACLDARVDIVCAEIETLVSDPDAAGRLRDVDVVTTSFLLHHVMASPDRGVTLLQAVRRAFSGAHHFLVADHVLTEPSALGEAPVFSVEFELLHGFMDVPTPSRRAYERLFRDTGLRLEQVLPFGHPDEWLFVLGMS